MENLTERNDGVEAISSRWLEMATQHNALSLIAKQSTFTIR
ncbi:hypothetical protein C942_04874 [Photobacterium marinum]|uniref:Uncharacterized protein n=1 Tax=Photobacterium marinum TaxID=1056511 RepID=L8JBV4_9GAMM|nr:hypothetical protein C942_04874 [Photobacterium marinum]